MLLYCYKFDKVKSEALTCFTTGCSHLIALGDIISI